MIKPRAPLEGALDHEAGTENFRKDQGWLSGRSCRSRDGSGDRAKAGGACAEMGGPQGRGVGADGAGAPLELLLRLILILRFTHPPIGFCIEQIWNGEKYNKGVLQDLACTGSRLRFQWGRSLIFQTSLHCVLTFYFLKAVRWAKHYTMLQDH